MKSFKQHYQLVLEFFDSIDGAVKHIDHLEENILTRGKQGVQEALNQIEASINYFVGESDYKISTKFDGCIHPNTMLVTETGNKPIIDIINSNEPVLVLGYDESTQQDIWVEARLPRINNNNKDWVEIELEDGTSLKCTEDHKIFTVNRGWVEAKELTVEDDLKIHTTTTATVSYKIKSIKTLTDKFEECDITTSTENFYINTGSTSFLIHNSPAIVAGLDNSNRFFVASKSAFAKNPKINYTEEDIDRNHESSPGLVEKLKLALRYLPSLDIKGIYQMDYMFDNRIKQLETPSMIDGVKNENSFVTFTPNTITYAVSPDSPYGRAIIDAKIGVAAHIEYMLTDGPRPILKVKKYNTDPSEFSSSKTVFVFNTLAGKPKNSQNNFSKILLRDVKKKKNQVLRLAGQIDFGGLDEYTPLLKAYINTEVRAGRFLEDPALSATEFVNFVTQKYERELNKLTSDKGKLKKQAEIKRILTELKALKPSIRRIFEVTKTVANLKNNLIKIFNSITKSDNLGTYMIESPGVWQTTSPEGYALSKTSGEPELTKFVDRLEFSNKNFAKGSPGAPAPTS